MADSEYPDEVWKTIPSFPDYEVSGFGNVRRVIPDKYGRPIGPMTGTSIGKGYRRFTLFVDGKRHRRDVHTLIAEAFIGKRPPKLLVCHADGDAANNMLNNLYYGTTAQNALDAIRHGTWIQGEAKENAKLTVDRVRRIRRGSERVALLAHEFGVSETLIRMVKYRQIWKHVI